MKQDDAVTMVVTSDEHASLHLHGYDVVAVAMPGQPATLEADGERDGELPAHGARWGTGPRRGVRVAGDAAGRHVRIHRA